MSDQEFDPAALAQATPFLTTRWSLVLAAAEQDSPRAAAALEQLCTAYWHPLYNFARRLGNSPDHAKDLTQGFFLQLLERRLVTRADRQAGRFRSFLLVAFKNFLADEHERAIALKRGGGHRLLPLHELDPEGRYGLEPADATTPEVEFDRRWALAQVEGALNKLRADYVASGRGPLYELLRDYVWGEKNALGLAQIAERLDLTEEAVKKAVQRLRQRFRDCLRAEVAQTVSTPDQIEHELRHLRAALSS